MIPSLYASVDYVRAVLRKDEAEADVGGVEGLWLRMLRASGERDDAAVRAREVSLAQYKGIGWHGMFVGADAKGTVVYEIPGSAADRYVTSGAYIGSVSRLDIQVTAVAPGRENDIIREEYERMFGLFEVNARGGRVGRPRLIIDEGYTAYSGKRSRSGRMLRVYNSGVKHGAKREELKGTIRYEVECTGACAKAAREVLEKEGWEQGAIYGMVVGDARRRGCICEISAIGEGCGVRGMRLSRLSQSDTMNWLKRQVRPAVGRMLESGVSKGELMEVLGLGGSV